MRPGLKPASVDAAGAFDVTEHIEDDLGFLRELGGILRPGGRLYVTVPAFPFLWSQEDTDTGHYRRYTLPAIEAVLRKAGFAWSIRRISLGSCPGNSSSAHSPVSIGSSFQPGVRGTAGARPA